MFSMKRLVYVNNHKHARFQVSDAKASTGSTVMVSSTKITSNKHNADKIFKALRSSQRKAMSVISNNNLEHPD